MSRKKTQFVRSKKTQTLARLTAVFVPMEDAVSEAESAISERLGTYNRLLNPKRAGRLSKGDMTRDNNQRKYDHVAAVHRERAAFDALCTAMEAMHPTLMSIKATVSEAAEEHTSLLRLNFIEACKLYKTALAVMSRFDSMDYEWTLDAYLHEEARAAETWLDGIPPLPECKDQLPRYQGHHLCIIAAHALHAADELAEGKNSTGGFLGDVGVCLRTQHEQSAGHVVAAFLARHGVDAFCQSEGDLQVNVGKKKRASRSSK
ncbi:MAG: hypothetical protein K2X80_19850 [Pseudomonadaceae bacterium]|nr:hypothetical protein [Pseudomonadaceae bacterium]